MYTAREVAERLGVSTDVVYAMRKRGEIGSIKLNPDRNNTIRFTEHHIANYLSDQKAKQHAWEFEQETRRRLGKLRRDRRIRFAAREYALGQMLTEAKSAGDTHEVERLTERLTRLRASRRAGGS